MIHTGSHLLITTPRREQLSQRRPQ